MRPRCPQYEEEKSCLQQQKVIQCFVVSTNVNSLKNCKLFILLDLMYDVSVTYHCFYYLYCFIHCDTLYFLTTQSCDCIIFYIHIKDKYISILETHITQFTLC